MTITAEKLREVLRYDHATGEFWWLVRPSTRVDMSKPAGTVLKDNGYRRIVIFQKRYRAHRLVWLYVYGKWPADQVDHINGDRLDNRLINLREATNTENSHNVGLKINNTSGYKGVCWHTATNKWVARIKINGKRKYLGLFTHAEEAHAAYCEAADIYHKEFARTQ